MNYSELCAYFGRRCGCASSLVGRPNEQIAHAVNISEIWLSYMEINFLLVEQKSKHYHFYCLHLEQHKNG